MQTRQLSRLAVLAASGALVLSACVQLPPIPVVSSQGFTAPAQPQGAVPIGGIGRSGGYQVGPITAHPTKPVCSIPWYRRGFVEGYTNEWNATVSDVAMQYADAHAHTPAVQQEIVRLDAMSILPTDFPPAPPSFYSGACRSGSEMQGQGDGDYEADRAWYPIHQKLIREHILTY